MSEIYYDDSNLQRLFRAMDPKQRMRVFKTAMRRQAAIVKAEVIKELRMDVRSSRQLERGVRAGLVKRGAGFKVTVAPRKGCTRSKSDGRPVAFWMETGTADRATKLRTSWGRRKRKGHYTGALKTYGFVQRTGRAVAPYVTESLRTEITESLVKLAKKYGID